MKRPASVEKMKRPAAVAKMKRPASSLQEPLQQPPSAAAVVLAAAAKKKRNTKGSQPTDLEGSASKDQGPSASSSEDKDEVLIRPLVLIWPADKEFQKVWARKSPNSRLALIEDAMQSAARAKATGVFEFLTTWIDYEGRDGAQSLQFYVEAPVLCMHPINADEQIYACEVKIECGIVGA